MNPFAEFRTFRPGRFRVRIPEGDPSGGIVGSAIETMQDPRPIEQAFSAALGGDAGAIGFTDGSNEASLTIVNEGVVVELDLPDDSTSFTVPSAVFSQVLSDWIAAWNEAQAAKTPGAKPSGAI